MEEKKNAQTEANKRWQEKNKEKAKYLSDRSRARNFIKKSAQLEDLEERLARVENNNTDLIDRNYDLNEENEKLWGRLKMISRVVNDTWC